MYTTIIHPLRKAYLLSITEYCILDSIWTLSNNQKFNGWCVMSKKQIADSLEISERQVYRAIIALEAKNLIKRSDNGFVQTTDSWNEKMANKQDWLLGFKGEDSFLSGNLTTEPQQLAEDPKSTDKMSVCMTECQCHMTKCHTDTDKMSYNNNSNNNSNNTKEKKYIKKRKSEQQLHRPSVTEIAEYCLKRQNGIDAEAFHDYYESKGWLIGKTPMVDWRAAVRTWERNNKPTEASYIKEMETIGYFKFNKKYGKELSMKYIAHNRL